MPTKTLDEKLLNACWKGHEKAALSALASGANPNAISPKFKGVIGYDEKCFAERSALLLAASNSSPKVVQALLNAGADIHLRSLNGMTPIMASIARPDILSILLSAGANPNDADIYGFTPLLRVCPLGGGFIASNGGKTAMGFSATTFTPAPAVPAALVSATMLLDAGADADAQNIGGRGCCSYALESDNAPLLQALIDAGADIHAHNGGILDEPISLSEQACRYGKTKCLDVLIRAGARIDEGYPMGPLYYAIRGANAGCVQTLLEAGARLSPAQAKKLLERDLTPCQGNVDHIKDVIDMYESLVMARKLSQTVKKPRGASTKRSAL